MPSVRASCCPLPLATPSGECVNHQSSVTLLCLNYKWGLFSMIKQICHASVGNMMECLPSGGWFSLGLRPRENHPPSGKHSIMLPPLAWHICIIIPREDGFREVKTMLSRGTFHQGIPTGMSYLFYYTEQTSIW